MTMCDYDADPPEFINVVFRKAAKAHKCCECLREIRAGETYEYISGKWDGCLSTFKTCERCSDLRDSLLALGFCPPLMELWEVYKEFFPDSPAARKESK